MWSQHITQLPKRQRRHRWVETDRQRNAVEHVYASIPGVNPLISTASLLGHRAPFHVGRLTVGILMALLFLPSVTRADSGGATISTLPDSQQLEGHVEVQHECGIEGCSWFGEAAQYPASVECPLVYDVSHGVWVGPVEQGSGTSSGNFSFLPEAATIILCLYVNAEGTSLVGQSHPFSTRTGSEVLPQPPGRSPSRTSVYVTVHGCKIKPHILINGSEEPIGGKSVWSLVRGHERTNGTIPANDEWRYFKMPPGRYRFSARFLGDSHLLPSTKAASTAFRIKRC
jgi:hypothetical protein